MLKTKYLFEIHVYRLKKNAYYDAMKKHIDKINSKMQIPMDTEYLRKQYGGDWQYNEIIGFLKFYQYGANQIRCEYWETDASRKVKTRKKQFIQISDSYCREPFSRNDTNVNLIKAIKSAVEHCEIRLWKKKRHLDKKLFNNTVEHIIWRDVFV
jgi:hypothetical protein